MKTVWGSGWFARTTPVHPHPTPNPCSSASGSSALLTSKVEAESVLGPSPTRPLPAHSLVHTWGSKASSKAENTSPWAHSEGAKLERVGPESGSPCAHRRGWGTTPWARTDPHVGCVHWSKTWNQAPQAPRPCYVPNHCGDCHHTRRHPTPSGLRLQPLSLQRHPDRSVTAREHRCSLSSQPGSALNPSTSIPPARKEMTASKLQGKIQRMLTADQLPLQSHWKTVSGHTHAHSFKTRVSNYFW